MRGWNSLPARLIYVVISTFLPLNIMVIAVAALVIIKASQQVQESYQRELDFTMEQQEEQLSQIDRHMNSLTVSYLTALTLAESNDNMISYEILKELSETFAAAEQVGIYYLYDKMSGQLFVKYTPYAYSYQEIEQLKSTSAEDVPQTPNEWRLCRLKGKWFSIRYYEYTNYRIGFLVDVRNTAETAKGTLPEEAELLFSDGRLTLRIAGGAATVEETSRDTLKQGGLRYQAVEWSSKALGLTLLARIPRSSFLGAIPVMYWVLLVISFLSVFLIFGLWRMLKRRVVGPIKYLEDAMKQLETQHLDYRITQVEDGETDEFRYLYEGFNRMAEEVESSYQKEIKMVKAQLDNLRLQVNPHMLLNSFHIIYSLAQSKNYECIQEFSLHLVEYFRYALKETDSFVTLQKEMAFVENYIGIQKIRFPGAFTCVYNIQPGAERAMVPPLLIQNFVENAMKYALVPDKLIEVLINVRREEDKLFLSVCDTGSGIREEVLERLKSGEVYVDKLGRRHIGIWNCRRRMEVFYGDKASLNIISSRGQGTQIWLELPFLTEQETAQTEK